MKYKKDITAIVSVIVVFCVAIVSVIVVDNYKYYIDESDMILVRAYKDKSKIATYSEIEELKKIIYKEFTEEECGVTGIYTTPRREVRADKIEAEYEGYDGSEDNATEINSVDGYRNIQLYAIDPEYAVWIGLEDGMKNGVAYFEANPRIRPHIEFNVIEKIYGPEHYSLGEEIGYDLATAVSPKENKMFLLLSEATDPIVYNWVGNNMACVSTETLKEINELTMSKNLNKNGRKLFEEQSILGVGIYCDGNKEAVVDYLEKCGYLVEGVE